MTGQDHSPQDARAAALAGDLRALIGKLKRRVRGQSPLGDLAWSQVAVLRHLEHEGPATVTMLARADGMRPQSMSANVAALEAAGLVQGTPDPNDGRQTIWSLTEACRDLIQAGRAARQDWLFRAIQTNLNPMEQEELARGIELLRRIAET